jgi:hypothetical protein
MDAEMPRGALFIFTTDPTMSFPGASTRHVERLLNLADLPCLQHTIKSHCVKVKTDRALRPYFTGNELVRFTGILLYINSCSIPEECSPRNALSISSMLIIPRRSTCSLV